MIKKPEVCREIYFSFYAKVKKWGITGFLVNASELFSLQRAWFLHMQTDPRVSSRITILGTLWTHRVLGAKGWIWERVCPWAWASQVAQLIKNLPAMQETQIWSLGWEDPLEKDMATHSSSLAWRIPWTEEPGRLQSMGLQRVGHDWVTSLHVIGTITFIKLKLCIRHLTYISYPPSRLIK